VEKIEGDQKKKAIYTLLPPEGTRKNLVLLYALFVVFNVFFVFKLVMSTVSEGSGLDIVRELTFISGDNGLTWRAEG
jgi:hypothetical protein